MNKNDKILMLIKRLNDMRHSIPLCELANYLECTEKTVRRLVKEIADIRQAPCIVHENSVIWSKHKSERVEIEEHWFTTQELQALLALNHSIAMLSSGLLVDELAPFANRVKKLLGTNAKMTSLASKIKLFESAGRKISDVTFRCIIQAPNNNKQLRIKFWNRYKDEVILRTISPQQLVRYRDHWLVDAYCHLRDDIRSFSLEAIVDIHLDEHALVQVDQQQLGQHFLRAAMGAKRKNWLC